MTARWLQRALDDAVEAAAYIAGDRPLAAASWRDGLIELVERLSVYPQSGRMVPESGNPELREAIHADSASFTSIVVSRSSSSPFVTRAGGCESATFVSGSRPLTMRIDPPPVEPNVTRPPADRP
ncbi:MAG TPA: type II toxin-antitoxin system RelE/ParE family toxin [Longimicrobium sp.]